MSLDDKIKKYNTFSKDKNIAEAIKSGEEKNKESESNEASNKSSNNFGFGGLNNKAKKKDVKKGYQFTLHKKTRKILSQQAKKRGYSSSSALLEDMILALENE